MVSAQPVDAATAVDASPPASEPDSASELGLLERSLRGAAWHVAAAQSASRHLVHAREAQLTAGLEQLDQLRASLEKVTVAVALEATARGCHQDSGLSVHDWLGSHCPWLSRTEVNDLVTVTDGLHSVLHVPIRAALLDGSLPVRRAARLLRCLTQVKPVTDHDTYARDIAILLPLAQDLSVPDADLRRATDHLLSLALPDVAHVAKAQTLQQLRGVNESSLADGSLTRFVITADPEGAATIRAVIASPLAAPVPDEDGPDPRTPTQRRYDALLTVIGRGVSSPHGTPTTAKARLVVTMSYDTLKDQLAGLGHALTGEALTATTVRKLACTAEIVPAVLGTDGEVLDLGRASRLASPAQHLLLWRRDRHCTYPGCTVPPQWCDAHHVDWYARGGRTDMRNLALLCGRHHSIVHQRDLHATVTHHGARWHTRR